MDGRLLLVASLLLETANKQGVPGLGDGGRTTVAVRQLCATRSLITPVCMQTADCASMLWLCIENFAITQGDTRQDVTGQVRFTSDHWDMDTLQAASTGYLARQNQSEQGVQPDLIPEQMRRMHCPQMPTELCVRAWPSGLERPLNVPLFTYVLSSPPEVTMRYWRNALWIVLRRERIKNLSDLGALPLVRRASLALLVCALNVQWMPYMPDTLEHYVRTRTGNLEPVQEYIEWFGDALFTQCGDCEDLGKAILLMVTAFTLREPIFRAASPPGSADPELEALRLLRQALSCYVPLLTLACVTSAAIDDKRTPPTDATLLHVRPGQPLPQRPGAHMLCLLLPIGLWQQMLRRGNGGVAPLGSELSMPITDDEEVGQLTVLYGEGTGPFGPRGEADPYAAKRSYVIEGDKNPQAAAVFGVTKQQTFHDLIQGSPFYKVMLTGVTNYHCELAVLQGVPAEKCQTWPRTFTFATDIGGVLHRGVSIDSLCNSVQQWSRMALVSAPPVPVALLKLLEDVVALTVPLPLIDAPRGSEPPRGKSYRAATIGAKAGAGSSPDPSGGVLHEDLMRLFCERMNREYLGPRRTTLAQLPVSFDVGHLESYLVGDPVVLEKLGACIASSPRIVTMSYRVERVTSGIQGYRLMFGVTDA